jgi:hypothetical protein
MEKVEQMMAGMLAEMKAGIRINKAKVDANQRKYKRT